MRDHLLRLGNAFSFPLRVNQLAVYTIIPEGEAAFQRMVRESLAVYPPPEFIEPTAYMDEAQQLADRVGIIDHRRIVVDGTPRELIGQMGADVIHIQGQGDYDEFIQRVSGSCHLYSL
jgi:hypothetical protein